MKTKIQHLVGWIILGFPLWVVLGGIAATNGLVPALLILLYIVLGAIAVWMGFVLVTSE